MNYCTNCGNKLNKENIYCENCGKKVALDKQEFVTPVIKKAKSKVDPEIRKLDLIIKLGVVMVLVASFILATTSWSLIPNLLKVISFLALSGLFFVLYKFCEKKIKINYSSNIYLITSLLFIFIAGICLCYFGVICKWFSFHGAGHYLTYSFLSLLVLGLTYILKRKFQNKFYDSIMLVSSIVAVVFALRFFNVGWLTDITVFSLVLLLYAMINFKKSYSISFNIVALVKIFFDGLVLMFSPKLYIVSAIVLIICNLSLILLLIYKINNKALIILNSIQLILFSLAYSMYVYNFNYKVTFLALIILLIQLLIHVLSLIFKNFNNKNLVLKVTRITVLSCALGLTIISFGTYFIFKIINTFGNSLIDVFDYRLNILCTSFILLLLNIFYTKVQKPNSNIYTYFLIPSTILFAYGLVTFVTGYFAWITYGFCFIMIAIIFFIASYLNKNKIYNYVSYSLCYLFLFIATFILLSKKMVFIESIEGIGYVLIPTLCLLSVIMEDIKYPNRKLFNWFAISLFIISVLKLSSIDIMSFGSLISNLIGFIILLLVLLLKNNNKVICYLLPFGLVLSLSSVLNVAGLSSNYSLIIMDSFLILMAYIFANAYKNKVFNILMIIITSLIILSLLTYTDMIISIYISVLCLLLIVYDIYRKDIKGLFVVGIVGLILNVLKVLFSYLNGVPFWLYMLIGGIIIIIISFVQIIKNDKNK